MIAILPRANILELRNFSNNPRVVSGVIKVYGSDALRTNLTMNLLILSSWEKPVLVKEPRQVPKIRVQG